MPPLMHAGSLCVQAWIQCVCVSWTELPSAQKLFRVNSLCLHSLSTQKYSFIPPRYVAELSVATLRLNQFKIWDDVHTKIKSLMRPCKMVHELMRRWFLRLPETRHMWTGWKPISPSSRHCRATSKPITPLDWPGARAWVLQVATRAFQLRKNSVEKPIHVRLSLQLLHVYVHFRVLWLQRLQLPPVLLLAGALPHLPLDHHPPWTWVSPLVAAAPVARIAVLCLPLSTRDRISLRVGRPRSFFVCLF